MTDKREQIIDKLYDLHGIQDNVMYDRFSKDGLQKELNEIMALICYLEDEENTL